MSLCFWVYILKNQYRNVSEFLKILVFYKLFRRKRKWKYFNKFYKKLDLLTNMNKLSGNIIT